MTKKVLLHTCCGVCAYTCVERLKNEGFIPVAFFFNPNIQPQIEYQKRRDAAFIVAETLGIQILEGEYRPLDWYKDLQPYGQETEGSRRCQLCYKLRLEESFKVSIKESCDYFTTTLSVSPHKTSSVIIEIGKDISRENFLSFDFKQEDGFKKSISAAKELNLYRQNYCGCTYSLRDRNNG
ncbi:MAG: epoxyqueuosine reductase QueH [Candidatus Omnitrophica bacterium]|nr:epoxyqueuosine reductase QueH [Candidatus Omnitrophota bacterium]